MSEHVCSTECLFVNRDGTIVCKMTGRCQSQFISANEYHIDTQELYTVKSHVRDYKGKKREKHSITAIETITIEVEKYLRLLLYSKKRNDMCQSESKIESSKSNHKRHYKKRRKITILEFNETKFKEISNSVCKIISRLLQHKPSSKLKPLIVALLFLKQHGKKYTTKTKDTFDIVRSEYLYQHLPSISDLHLFDIQKNLVRIGSNTIQKIVRNI